MAEWIANNYAVELNVPPRPDIQQGTPSISGEKCQGEYKYMVYVFAYSSSIWYIHELTWLCSLQDCLATIPPHPFYIGERDDDYDIAEFLFDQDSMWFVRPQLFFHCKLRPIGTAGDRFNCSNEDIPLDLFSSAPLRNFAWGQLESWNQKEFTGYTSPHLFPRSTSEGLTTSLAKSLSFHVFWTVMQPQLFHISTAADSSTLLSAAVPMVRALPRGGAAMFTRSTPGCGTLDGPSLAWATSQWRWLRRSEGSLGLRLPSADGQLGGSQVTLVWYMSGIYMVYTWYIPGISCTTVNHAFWVLLSSWPENPCSVHVFPIHPVLIAPLNLAKLKDHWN